MKDLPFGPTTALDPEVAKKVESLVERKESEWKTKGYPEHLIRMGKEMIREWVFEMKEAWKLSPEKVQETATPYGERMTD